VPKPGLRSAQSEMGARRALVRQREREESKVRMAREQKNARRSAHSCAHPRRAASICVEPRSPAKCRGFRGELFARSSLIGNFTLSARTACAKDAAGWSSWPPVQRACENREPRRIGCDERRLHQQRAIHRRKDSLDTSTAKSYQKVNHHRPAIR